MRTQILSLLLSALVFAQPAFANRGKSCDIKMVGGSAPYTSENKAKIALQEKIDAIHAKSTSGPALYFVFSDGKSPEIETLPIPHAEDSDRMQVSPELTKRLAKSGPVKIYNRTAHREGEIPVGAYSSIYFLPYTVSEFKNIHPKTDFDEAPNIGPGCTMVEFKNHETLSLAYGSISHYADNIVALNRKPKSSDIEERIAGEIKSLKVKKVGTGSGRSPASTSAPVIAADKVENRTKKKLQTKVEPKVEKKEDPKKVGGGG